MIKNSQYKPQNERLSSLFAIKQSLVNLLKISKSGIKSETYSPYNDSLFPGILLIGKIINQNISLPHNFLRSKDDEADFIKIINSSNISTRKVKLQKNWHHHSSNNIMVVFCKITKRPIFLLPLSSGKFLHYDFINNTKRIFTDASSKNIHNYGYVIYKPLPIYQKKYTQILFRWFLTDTRKDLLIILSSALLIGAISIFIPFCISILFSNYIPYGQIDFIWQLVVLVILASLFLTILNAAQKTSINRICNFTQHKSTTAIIQHLMKLPLSFFRSSPGSSIAFDTYKIQESITTGFKSFFDITTSGILIIFYLIFISFYNTKISILAFILVAVQAIFMGILSYYQLQIKQKLDSISSWTYGLLYQSINIIPKIRTVATEEYIFMKFASSLKEQMNRNNTAGKISLTQSSFNASYNIFAIFTVIIAIYSIGIEQFHAGEYIAIIYTFAAIIYCSNILSKASIEISKIFSPLKEIAVLVKQNPEINIVKKDPGTVKGHIELNNAYFGYFEHSHKIINNASLIINPGEMTAIVGLSGVGKSTILKIMLGFEKLDSGYVFFDGMDINTVDIRKLRKQIGTVLQTTKLMPGTIYSNISVTTNLSLDDAWLALKNIGFDSFVKELPLGMQTILSEGNSGLSGGQRQQLLLARAIALKPQILFLDEATSAMDNQTQDKVIKHINKIASTRIIISSRLSTIKYADNILVFNDGKIVQQGTYENLIAQKGIFSQLAKRQLA